MLNLLRRLFDENIRNFTSQSAARQAGVIGIGAGLLAFLILVFFLLTQEAYEPLFPGVLDSEATGEIVAVLQANNIPYRLGGLAGGQILVPLSQKPTALRLTAQEGVLAGASSAFDFLDETQFGTTDPILTLKNKRGKERQLRAVLRQFKFVRNAEVILTPEEKALLERDYRPAQAAVQLDVRGTPPPEAVRGIVDLIRLSLPGLKENNIVVTDLHGRRLNEVRRETLVEHVAEQYELIQAEQDRIRESIVRHLEGVLGAGNAVVTVALEKDFDQREDRTHLVDPNSVVAISEQRTRETSSDRATGGEPGVGSNIPDTAVAGGAGASGNREFEERVTNNVVSSTDTTIKRAVGRTRRVSAAVTINYKRVLDPQTGRVTNQYVERSPEDMEDLQRLVRASLPPLDGGEVQLTMIQKLFDQTSDVAAQQEAEAADRIERFFNYWLPFGGLAAIIVALVLLMWYNANRAMRLEQQRAEAELERAHAETQRRQRELSLLELGIGEVTDISHLSPEEQRRIKLAQKVEEFCSEKPEEAAGVVKTWLAE